MKLTKTLIWFTLLFGSLTALAQTELTESQRAKTSAAILAKADRNEPQRLLVVLDDDAIHERSARLRREKRISSNDAEIDAQFRRELDPSRRK